MNLVEKRGIIEEIEYGNNFGYLVNNSSDFTPTDYKILVSQTNGVFVRCMKTLYNGRIQLFYVTDEYRPVSSMLAQVSPDALVTIFMNLISDVLQVQNNGFLNCQNIDLSWDRIYVETSTLKVRLVYVPVNQKSVESFAIFETELRSGIVRMIHELPGNYTSKLQSLSADLSNTALSLQDVNNHLHAANIDIGKIDKGLGEGLNSIMQLHLVALNAPYSFEIPVKQKKTLIGKKQGAVDVCIPYNDKISRKHCLITMNNGEYEIEDQGSKNGTFVNNIRILPGSRHPLHKNDEVRLADSRFRVEMDG